jgi:hypothetical protein
MNLILFFTLLLFVSQRIYWIRKSREHKPKVERKTNALSLIERASRKGACWLLSRKLGKYLKLHDWFSLDCASSRGIKTQQIRLTSNNWYKTVLSTFGASTISVFAFFLQLSRLFVSRVVGKLKTNYMTKHWRLRKEAETSVNGDLCHKLGIALLLFTHNDWYFSFHSLLQGA